MDAALTPYADEQRDLAIIMDCVRAPLALDVFGGSYVELTIDERKRVELPPTALDRARARWRHASIAE